MRRGHFARGRPTLFYKGQRGREAFAIGRFLPLPWPDLALTRLQPDAITDDRISTGASASRCSRATEEVSDRLFDVDAW